MSAGAATGAEPAAAGFVKGTFADPEAGTFSHGKAAGLMPGHAAIAGAKRGQTLGSIHGNSAATVSAGAVALSFVNGIAQLRGSTHEAGGNAASGPIAASMLEEPRHQPVSNQGKNRDQVDANGHGSSESQAAGFACGRYAADALLKVDMLMS